MPQFARLTALPSPVHDLSGAPWPLASTASDRARGPLPHCSPGDVLRRAHEVLG